MSYTFRSKHTRRTITEIEPAPEQALDLVVDDYGPITGRKSAIPQQRNEAV